VKISGYMYKFQDLTPISGQISKFQDNAQACFKHYVLTTYKRPVVALSITQSSILVVTINSLSSY